MKDVTIKTKTSQTLFLILGILLFGSCKNEGESTTNNGANSEIEHSEVDKELLIGSWKDTSAAALDFTLFKNGTARSDNMKTLHYKNWSVKGNEITFTIESIGNGTTSTDNSTYILEELTADELILKKGDYLAEYNKK